VNIGDFEHQIICHGGLTEPSVATMRPMLPRWTATHAWVVEHHGHIAASNFLTLCILQAMPVRDKAKEHHLRNLMPWLRPYHV
jgi:hypothetical protein